MEKDYEITEKQMLFLNSYLLRKYPGITEEIRIELTDHLISDFEATTKNGNLSEYLSNELVFIRKFVFDSANRHQKKYGKETWRQFLDFFMNLKLLPIVFSLMFIFYLLANNLNNKWLWVVFIMIQSLIMLASVFFGMIHNKKLRKLDEVKYLGADIWLSYLLVQFPIAFGFDNFIVSYDILFSIYASFTLIHAMAAYMVIKEKRNIIIEKYQHLLN